MSRRRTRSQAAWWRGQDQLSDPMRKDIERHLRVMGSVGKTHGEAMLREIARLRALLDERLEEMQSHPCSECDFLLHGPGLWLIDHREDGAHECRPWARRFTTWGKHVRVGPDRNDIVVEDDAASDVTLPVA